VLSYPVRIVETGEGKVRVIFFDVPEAVAEAGTEEEALYRARFALELSLGHYVLHGREVPVPSKVPGAPTVATDKFGLPEVREPPAEPAEAGGDARAAPGGGRY
jgi:predicted RNase H-like HicB family nuclease